MNRQVAKWLFETSAIQVCPPNKPFWYTSGRIGPFYVNTHFLYGNEEKANGFLKQIDTLMQDHLSCSRKMEELVLENLTQDSIYAGVIESMVQKIKCEVPLAEITAISAGERRDWFFSFAIAHLLGKPHVTLFKDKDAILYTGLHVAKQSGFPDHGMSVKADDCNGMKFLHIADLITTASSYQRAWVPAIKNLHAEMPYSLVVVDRLQGGRECLSALGVESLALINVESTLFEMAVNEGVLEESQLIMVQQYMKDPEGSMKAFVQEHPEFMENALQSDEKTKLRAKLCIDSGFYS